MPAWHVQAAGAGNWQGTAADAEGHQQGKEQAQAAQGVHAAADAAADFCWRLEKLHT